MNVLKHVAESWPCTLPGKRHFWSAFAGYSNGPRTPMLYSEHKHYWYAEDYGWISMPWAVTDDYGDLVAVPSPC